MSSEAIVWIAEAWTVADDDAAGETNGTLRDINRKVNHLLGGLATVIEAFASIRERLDTVEAELQPVLDAIDALANEEGDVAAAVAALESKVTNGQVVSADDVQTLVTAIGGVTDKLKAVVASTTSPENSPITTTPTPDAPAPVEATPVEGSTPVETAPADSSAPADSAAPVEAPPAPVVEAPVPEVPAAATDSAPADTAAAPTEVPADASAAPTDTPAESSDAPAWPEGTSVPEPPATPAL